MQPHPKKIEIIARGLWQIHDHVLVCRPIRRAYCYLPGGHVEPGESAAAALVREFAEETGIAVRVGALRLVHEHRFVDGNAVPRHEINLMFHVAHPGWELIGTAPREVTSREPEIEFAWLRKGEVENAVLVPAAVGAWLRRTGAQARAEPERVPGAADQTCEWLSD